MPFGCKLRYEWVVSKVESEKTQSQKSEFPFNSNTLANGWITNHEFDGASMPRVDAAAAATPLPGQVDWESASYSLFDRFAFSNSKMPPR